jgi:malate dehydrogenase (oxaloacetate-decarboxylating)
MAKKPTDTSKQAIALHKKLGGKIRITPAQPVRNRAELSLVYTPGVAAVSTLVAGTKQTKKPLDEQQKLAREYTVKKRLIAVISDGSAVLGLGNIGPYGALPVMEGKAALFKAFADVDAVPITLATQQTDEIVETIINIAPAFGGINLEDFAAPQCFEIEARVKEALNIPVMHDDQHGTAIAVYAALLNAAKVTKREFKKMRVVISGAGAAGTAIAKLLILGGVKDILVLDSKGVINKRRKDLNLFKQELATITNPMGVEGDLSKALAGADAFVGVSAPNSMTAEQVKLMDKNPIVFALANPIPEIMPEEAKKGGAAVIATGRSDYPNQINNSLVFPGVFRGALDNKVTKITDDMKIKAAHNLAALVKRPTAEKIIPGPFEKGIAKAVAKAIK